MAQDENKYPVFPYGTNHSEKLVKTLSQNAYEFRKQVLTMVHQHQTGHIGGAFSIAEVLVALYFHHLRIDPNNPLWAERDRLIFSKGHACAMLYTCMAYRGYFPVEELKTFRNSNSRLQGHPDPHKLPGIEVPAGPLGHGIAISVGMALSAKSDHSKHRIYTILGDGEINAGIIWEGALLASKYKLDNITAILDYNGVQQTGTTHKTLSTEPIADKWRAFGWHVIEIHGHNMRQVLDALDFANEVHNMPTIIIARTTKGKGVSFMEMDHHWHGAPPNDDQYQAALKELDAEVNKWKA